MNLLGKTIAATMVPLGILNLLAGVVGGIWLIILGEWHLALYGVIAGTIFPFAYGIVNGILMLSVGALLARLSEKRKTKTLMVVGFLNMSFNNVINLAWVICIFALAISIGDQLDNLVPSLLFGYSVATGPFRYMAEGETPDSWGTYSALYLTQIAYILLVSLNALGANIFILPLLIIITISIQIYLLRIVAVSQRVEHRSARVQAPFIT